MSRLSHYEHSLKVFLEKIVRSALMFREVLKHENIFDQERWHHLESVLVS